MALTVGTKLGSHEITGLLGKGGMGEVYRARDLKLKREVAIKILPDEFSRDADRVSRFQREAEVLASLNHPNIGSIYDLAEGNQMRYLVLELVEGETLADRISRGAIPAQEALEIARHIAEALEAAHERGIVHRDLKPANIKLTPDGKVKVLDFGLAKSFQEKDKPSLSNSPTSIGASAPGVILGTVAYMSPEQSEGRQVDARSDIFALGVVLYEMLGGRHPFSGETTLATLASILREDPPSLRRLRPGVSAELERIVLRCMAKKPEHRYGSATEVARDFEQLRQPVVPGITLRRPLVVALAVVLLAGLGVMGTRWYMHSSRARWAETVAVPQAAQLIEHNQPLAALKLVQQAEQYVPSSRELIRLKEDLPIRAATIETEPPGAEIYVTDYADPKAADFSQWEHLGRSPLATDRLPRGGYYRIRAIKDGFEPVESAAFVSGLGTFRMELQTTQAVPPGMVWIPLKSPTSFAFMGVELPAVQIPGAWMDKYEVTNREFKKFVDAGGYQKREYWKQPFIKDGKDLTWEQAIANLRDATGRPGPATWEAGSYPDGKADYPVGGVSWYEAAAYAEFAGKSLPTVYHWGIAAGFGLSSQIIALSNFAGMGPTRVGSNLGLAPFGTYDMAGNVKEWTANRSGEKRYILGGGWNESSYMFQVADARSPWDRDATFGFRCVRYVSPVPEALNGPIVITSRDRSPDQPVDDRTFQVFKSLHSYDKTDLKTTLDSVHDAPHWRREDVSFQAVYGNERVILHLYLPKDAAPPYQAVFYFSGNDMFLARTPEEVSSRLMEYIVKSGRAVVLPAYAGTLERGPTPVPTPPGRARDLAIQQIKDVARTIDYLETRHDIDTSKLAYCGLSYGAGEGVRVLGLEQRFKAAVLVSGGSRQARSPEADSWNYAPRVKVPVLMLNGHDDSISPVETSQNPMFKALGTPEKDKRHMIFPGGHVDFRERNEVIKEALDWLDHYLGLVKVRP